MATFIIVTPFEQNTADEAQMTKETYNADQVASVRDLATSAQVVFSDGKVLHVRETFAEINKKLGAK